MKKEHSWKINLISKGKIYSCTSCLQNEIIISGGRYDELGNLHDWWETATAKKFHEKAECFIRQYDSIKVEEVGIHLNGRLSVGENIADNAGVKTALMVCHLYFQQYSTSAYCPVNFILISETVDLNKRDLIYCNYFHKIT